MFTCFVPLGYFAVVFSNPELSVILTSCICAAEASAVLSSLTAIARLLLAGLGERVYEPAPEHFTETPLKAFLDVPQALTASTDMLFGMLQATKVM